MSDGFDESVEGSCGGLSQCGFELSIRLFDWIEVGAIGWQIAQRRASSLNRFFDASDFVTGEIIHDHDVAIAQSWGEKVFDIGQETRSVHRPIENTGRDDRIVAQGGDECRRHPMAMRHSCDETLTTGRPAIEPDHICLRPSFINEDKMFRVQIRLARAPLLTGFDDIGTILFSGAQ